MALSLRSRRSRFDDEYDEDGNGPNDPKSSPLRLRWPSAGAFCAG